MKTELRIGWREYVSLPDWGVKGVVAKIDTGARTSAVHVEKIRRLPGRRVQFEVVTRRAKVDRPEKTVPVEAAVIRSTRVRSSTGHSQERFVVATRVRIGSVVRRIELSLVRREHMLCRMLLGRTALDGLLVDATRTHILGEGIPKRRKLKP